MTEALLGLFLGLGGTFLVMLFATHMTLLNDFKYYKPIYESFKQGEYKFSTLGDLIYFNKGYDEIVFFPDSSIKLNNDVYIHSGFISSLSPYSLYYKRKFNKVKNHLITQHMRDREIQNLWRAVPMESQTPAVKDTKPFKLLRG
jgi:hypothetical protein